MQDEHRAIILRLGGYRRVSERLGEPLTTVQSWDRRNSIPPSAWRAIIELAAEDGFSLDSDDLLRSAPARPKRDGHTQAAAKSVSAQGPVEGAREGRRAATAAAA